MNNEKIYVVTRGTYSDYHIITATTDYDKAVAIKEKFSTKYEEAKIEEYNDCDLKMKTLWCVRFERDGSVIECAQTKSVYEYEYGINVCKLCIRGQIYTHVIADTHEEAIKIAAEKRAEFIAGQLGL